MNLNGITTKEQLFELYNFWWSQENDSNHEECKKNRELLVEFANKKWDLTFSQFNFEFHYWNSRKRPEEYNYGPETIKGGSLQQA